MAVNRANAPRKPVKNRLAWTGFFPYTDKEGKTERGKTLWDWMDLLLVPLLIAGGIWAINQITQANDQARAERQAQIDREISLDTARETTLQSYLDRMDNLLLSENLGQTDQKIGADIVARRLTLTVLRRLDANRKGIVLRFLYDAKLIRNNNRIVRLTEADLSGAVLSSIVLSVANLDGADLTNAVLTGTDLSLAELVGTSLMNADLTEENLHGADLKLADLTGAILHAADLSSADLSISTLAHADLTGADLSGANLSGSTIDTATKMDADTTLPDGSHWASDTDLSKFGVIIKS